MRRGICSITNKVFDCLNCTAIEDGEECPYMVHDEATEYNLRFSRKLAEKEMREKIEKEKNEHT